MVYTWRLVSWLPWPYDPLTLGVYDDRKDTLVRELDGKREELDGVAAR